MGGKGQLEWKVFSQKLSETHIHDQVAFIIVIDRGD